MSTFRVSRSTQLIAVVVACLSSFATLTAIADGPSTKNGAFTAAQAERGRLVYEKSCQNCHQADFYLERLPKWESKSVGALFQSVSTTMPADNVGSLLTSEYLDVLTYVLSITGSPAGKTELTADNMDSVTIVLK